MPSSLKEMLTVANAAVPRVPPAEVRALIDRGNVLIVDVRDPSEVQASGKIKGAVNVSRGMPNSALIRKALITTTPSRKIKPCWSIAPRAVVRRWLERPSRISAMVRCSISVGSRSWPMAVLKPSQLELLRTTARSGVGL